MDYIIYPVIVLYLLLEFFVLNSLAINETMYCFRMTVTICFGDLNSYFAISYWQRDLNEAVVNDDSLSNPGRVSLEQTVSAEELEDRMDQFTYIMQQKFLLGEDQEHLDYSKIDNDETLDDHWQREANIDAEERYFADD